MQAVTPDKTPAYGVGWVLAPVQMQDLRWAAGEKPGLVYEQLMPICL